MHNTDPSNADQLEAVRTHSTINISASNVSNSSRSSYSTSSAGSTTSRPLKQRHSAQPYKNAGDSSPVITENTIYEHTSHTPTTPQINDRATTTPQNKKEINNKINNHKCFTFLSIRSQKLFKSFFYKLGIEIEKRPCVFLVCGILLMLLCGIGFIRFNFETRFLYIITPRDSMIWHQYTHTIELFGEPSALMSLLITAPKNENNNVITPLVMNTSFDIYDTINGIEMEQNNIYYHNVCLPIYPYSDVCVSDATNMFTVVFNDNQDLWANDTILMETVNANPDITAAYIGGLSEISENDNGNGSSLYINEGTVISLIYELQPRDVYGVDEYMSKWLHYWSKSKNDYKSEEYGNVEIDYVSDRSLDDEVWRVIIGDLYLFGIAFVLMISYFIIVLGEFSCVNARVWLALSIGLVLIASLVIGYGIGMAMGAELSLIVLLVPYVLLGVGVDDICIIVHSYDENNGSLPQSLSQSGMAVSLTSICSIVALFIAAGVEGTAPVITTFCVLGGLSFLANYIIQFLIFVPLLVFDERRKHQKRNFCCFCCITHDSDIMETETEKVTNGKKNWDALCSDLLVNKILKYRVIRLLICCIFAVTLYFSIVSIQYIDTQSDLTKIVPDDSYMIDYYNTFEYAFNDQLLSELQIVIEMEDFADMQTRNNVLSFLNEIENNANYITQQNWFEPFILQWLPDRINASNVSDIDSLSNNEFYEYLNEFAHNESSHSTDIIIIENDDGFSIIKATRFYLIAFQSSDNMEQWKEYQEWNELLSDFDLNGYIFQPSYGYSYFSSVIVHATVENVMYAALGVFVILLLTTDLRMSVFIICIVASIDMHLFGFMYICGFSLDIITYCTVVMAVGLTVDYVIHITFSISEVKSDSFNQRLDIAMNEIGVSVLKGAFTSLLGGFPLLFSQSLGFRIFGAMWIGIIVISVLHGFLLVPCILNEIWCLCGGNYNNNQNKNADNADQLDDVVQNKKSVEFVTV